MTDTTPARPYQALVLASRTSEQSVILGRDQGCRLSIRRSASSQFACQSDALRHRNQPAISFVRVCPLFRFGDFLDDASSVLGASFCRRFISPNPWRKPKFLVPHDPQFLRLRLLRLWLNSPSLHSLIKSRSAPSCDPYFPSFTHLSFLHFSSGFCRFAVKIRDLLALCFVFFVGHICIRKMIALLPSRTSLTLQCLSCAPSN